MGGRQDRGLRAEWWVVLLALFGMAMGKKEPSGRCSGVVNFTISMTYVPYNPPNIPPSDDMPVASGYLPLLCVVHDERFRLWQPRSALVPPLVNIILTRNFSDAFTYLSTFKADNGSVYNWTTSSLTDEGAEQTKLYASGDAVNITVSGDDNATVVACFTALYPSPDWFLGFYEQDLCQLNETTGKYSFLSPQTKTEMKFYYDGGFDRQETPGLAPDPVEPQTGVTAKTNRFEAVGEYTITNLAATPTPTPAPPESVCFPAGARVRLPCGSSRAIENIRLGDVVESGVNQSSPTKVYLQTHADADAYSGFVRLHFDDGGTLTASGSHYVAVTKGDGPGILAMDELVVGSRLISYAGSSRLVVRVEWVWERGLYNPHTMSGYLIVEDTLVTSYTRALAVRSAHGVLAFPRALYRCGLGNTIWNIVHRASSDGHLGAMFTTLVPLSLRR